MNIRKRTADWFLPDFKSCLKNQYQNKAIKGIQNPEVRKSELVSVDSSYQKKRDKKVELKKFDFLDANRSFINL